MHLGQQINDLSFHVQSSFRDSCKFESVCIRGVGVITNLGRSCQNEFVRSNNFVVKVPVTMCTGKKILIL